MAGQCRESDQEYFLEIDALTSYITFIMIYNFHPKKMKIQKFKKLVANLHSKTEYVIHIRNLKQNLNYDLLLKKGT